MGRKSLTKAVEVLQDVIDIQQKQFVITEASVKDDFCDYSYQILHGVGKDRVHKVNGKNSGLIIDTDLQQALVALHPHMACIDMAFKDSAIEVDDINAMSNHDLTFRYTAIGFKIKGSEDDESIIIIGTKSVDMGFIPFESPKISLSESSSYKWYNELKEAAGTLRMEVELYDAGKGTKSEEDEPEDLSKQGKLFGAGNDNDDFDKDEE